MVEENRGPGIPGNSTSGTTLWMLILGGYSALRGIMAIPQWAAYPGWTQLYYAVSAAAGICLTILALIQVGSRPKTRFLATAEVGVLALLTANHLAGLFGNTIVCYTPS